MKTLLITTIAFAAFLGAGSPASAEPVNARIVAAVSTAGLDLTTRAGVRSLDRRIQHAASALCGTPSPADARGRIKTAECRAQAFETARAERARLVEIASARGAVQLAANR